MNRLIAYMIRFPVWVTVLKLSVIAFGLIALSQMTFSFFPETTPDIINVMVPYPGASPDEVAEGVVLKIEEQLDGLEGVDRITSVSRENIGRVTIEITKGADIEKALNDVKNAVDRIGSFPEDSEKPVIFQQEFRMRSLSVVLYGEADLYNLKFIAEEFRDNLLARPKISQVSLQGLPDLEFSIEVSESDLRRYQLTFDEITNAIRQANVNISGGKFETPDEEILIRAWGQGYFMTELLNIPIRGNPNGTSIYLSDIAEVKEQWEDVPDKSFYNGRNAVIINIDRTQQEDIIKIANVTKEEIAKFNLEHDTVEAKILDDRTIPLRQRVELLVKNGIIGLILVVISLGFFLNLRLSFWVAISIPFSFAGMFIVANAVGITINVISLFGMIIVVGILVDDAIVVGEKIYTRFERGESAFTAAINGTRDVMAPVTTSVLTTVMAFMPFFFLDGMMGKFIWQMALVVSASLMFSLVEAFLILPSHLAHSKGLRPHKQDPPIRKKIEKFIHKLTHDIYSPILRTTLKYKWLVITAPLALVLMTIGLVFGGHIGVTFFPYVDSDVIPVNVSLVSGRQEADTDAILQRIEKAAREVNEEIKDERDDSLDIILGIKRDVGSNALGESGSHAGSLTIQLLDGEEREMESYLIGNRIRDKVGNIPEVRNMTFGRSGHFGKAVSLSLLSKDPDQLQTAKKLLVAELRNFTTLKDITDSDYKGRREVNITLKPRAHALGLTLRDIAGQVRQGFFGQEIQRIQRGRDEIRVWVRYRPEERAALGFLDNMRIRTRTGEEYPFSELADYNIERGVTSINHLNRMREVKVEANQANIGDDLPPILNEIEFEVLPRVLSQVSGVTYSFEGQTRDQAKSQASIRRAFPIALMAMVILVILVFRSYLQAMIIFSLIPIGFLGAIWGHGIQGIQLNMLSMFGTIALSGIIINDSIVLVDQINRNLRNGQKVIDAIHNAGLIRLRPIILTTMTTALGLAPLILETSRQAQFLIPMAVSVAYGLVFGTLILLLILPATFLAVNDIRVRATRFFLNRQATSESVEPAVKEMQTLPIE
ncbi:MAG: efflux RND transporter permease subunit [candidate division Zixibacteria bacterium]